MNKTAAIYSRVSSDRQKENHTIASQTTALIEHAQAHGYTVPSEWVFQDEGYSGAILSRPGLEALRDLAAQGQITAALVYSPDRLSRKYAYQVLLAEELSRCGVELVFLKSSGGTSPEDQLVVQFQGMIAEYERAQIAERCRRGKRHKAQQGTVNVLSGAPYGYRYVRKSETSAAYYEVIDAEAKVVRIVFEAYTQQGLSINAIARLLNERQIPTRTAQTRWERSTVWGMLRNPAYVGKAAYGKTELRPRQRITRPLRQRKGVPSRDSANHERPRQDWIVVPVPALIREEMFALAQEQLEKNKHHSPRRTVEPTLLQGMLVCQQCGYALYRTSTRTSKQKLNYYRCLGSDGYRRLKGSLCGNRPIRQDYLDRFVWNEIIRLLEDSTLIQTEIDHRREVARSVDPLRRREEELGRERARLEKNMERIITAYQEGLVTLAQLRQRMPGLRKNAQAAETELQSLQMAAMDEAKYLQLAETLTGFRDKLRSRAETMEVRERQQILRLIVKEILVGANTITLRHSLPIPQSGPGSNGSTAPRSSTSGQPSNPGYLLRTGSHRAALRRSSFHFLPPAFLEDACLQPRLNQLQYSPITDSKFQEAHEPFVAQTPEKVPDIHFKHVLHSLAVQYLVDRGQCVMTSQPLPETERAFQEILLVDFIQNLRHRPLDRPIDYRRNPDWTL
jgi:site-specific DNA recombinase